MMFTQSYAEGIPLQYETILNSGLNCFFNYSLFIISDQTIIKKQWDC